MNKAFSLLLAALCLGASTPLSTVSAAAETETGIEKPVNLWPLVYQRRTPDSFEFELLFSLFAYERDRAKTTLAVRPLYYRERDRAEDSLRLGILWPLADYKRVKDDSRLWVLPLFWRRVLPGREHSLLFPLYSHRRDQAKTRLGVIGYTPFTLFDFQRDRDKDTVHHRYILWTYDREGRSSHVSFLPLYEQSRAPGVASYSVIPLFAYYRNENDDSKRVSALGFPDTWNLMEYRRRGTDYKEWHFLILYRLTSAEAQRLVLFPVYWDLRRRGDRKFHVWPLYSHITKGTSEEYGTVWPLFRYRSDPEEGEKDLKLFWPLFREASGPGEFRNHRLFPLYAINRNPDSKDRPTLLVPGLVSPLPLLYMPSGQGWSFGRFFWLAWWCDTEKRKNEFVLNYYSVMDKDAGWRHRGLFPLWHTSSWDDRRVDFLLPTYFAYRDPGLDARTFFPLYYRYHTPETSWGAFVPVYFRYHSDPLTLRVLFPFYYYTKNVEQKSEFAYYFPVYGWYRRGSTAASHYLFFPLYARFYDAETRYRSWDVLWPLFHHDTEPGGGSTRVLPLYWASRDKESSFRAGFPLYWEFTGPESSQRHVIPFYGSYRSSAGFRLDYIGGPLYVRLRDEPAQTDRRAWLAFLAGRVKDRDETRSYLFPLYWAKRSPEESRLFLLPLFGRETSGPASTTFLLGIKRDWSLFQFGSDRTTGWSQTRALLYQSKRDAGGYSRVVFPLYWSWGGDQSTFDLLFPLYAWQTARPEARRELSLLGLHDGLSLFHFVRQEKEPRRLDRVLIFSRDVRPSRTRTGAFPLFWHTTEPDQTRSLFLPLYSYHSSREDGENRLGLLGVTPVFSLFSRRDEPDGYSHRLWPLYGYRSSAPRERELGLLGVWYPWSLIHFQSAPERFQHHLFPLYTYERTGAQGAPERNVHAAFLWQVVAYQREGPEDRDFRFLWRLVKVTKKQGSTDTEVNPFYFRISEPGKGSYWAVLGGLFGREHKPDGTARTRLFWLINI